MEFDYIEQAAGVFWDAVASVAGRPGFLAFQRIESTAFVRLQRSLACHP
jgi:hypothetical protein